MFFTLATIFLCQIKPCEWLLLFFNYNISNTDKFQSCLSWSLFHEVFSRSEQLWQHEDKLISKFKWNFYINLMNHVFEYPIEYDTLIMSKKSQNKRNTCDRALVRWLHWQWENMALSSIDVPKRDLSSSLYDMLCPFLSYHLVVIRTFTS